MPRGDNGCEIKGCRNPSIRGDGAIGDMPRGDDGCEIKGCRNPSIRGDCAVGRREGSDWAVKGCRDPFIGDNCAVGRREGSDCVVKGCRNSRLRGGELLGATAAAVPSESGDKRADELNGWKV
jgi:hypothetical protein